MGDPIARSINSNGKIRMDDEAAEEGALIVVCFENNLRMSQRPLNGHPERNEECGVSRGFSETIS
jgi:hypothetical protein